MTFLIIENSLPMRRMIRSFINDTDAEIFECGSPTEALNLSHFVPEWVLFNLEIKDVDGIAEIAQIKEKWGTAKIVAMSIYDETELCEAALKAGACAYVLKEDLSALRRLFLQ